MMKSAYRLGWETVQHGKEEGQGRMEKNHFQIQQEEKPLYGLIGMKMVALS